MQAIDCREPDRCPEVKNPEHLCQPCIDAKGWRWTMKPRLVDKKGNLVITVEEA